MRLGFHQLTFLLLLMIIFLCSGATVRAADGWELIWHNQQAQARTAFHVTLAQHPNDAQALFGLAMLADTEGDEVSALQAWGRFYHCAAASWPALAYWPRVVELAESTGRYTILDTITQDILTAKGAPAELRASARLAQAAAAERAGNFTESERLSGQMGYLRQWRIIGPFDNVAKSGFTKQFAPEREIDFHMSYPGLDNQSIGWHPLLVVAHNGECEIGTCLGDRNESVFYAVTAIYSSKTLPVKLCLAPAGASKVFLNGTLLFADDKYREAQNLVADPYCAAATLQQGWNTILIKIASDERTLASFAVRCTTPEGDNIPGLRTDPTRANSMTLTPSPVSSPVESTTAILLRNEKMSNGVALALAYQLHVTHDYQAAENLLRSALAKTPDASWLHLELSLALQQDKQTDAAREERDRARKLNSRLAKAEWDYLTEQKESLPAAQYLKQAKELHALFPADTDIALSLEEAYDSAEMKTDTLSTARAIARLQQSPNGQSRLLDVLDDADRESEISSVLTAALKSYPNAPTLIQWRADYLKKKGNISGAIALYQRLLQIDTPWPHYRHELADLYISSGNKAAAVQVLRTAREQCPNDADLCVQLADVLRDLGKKTEAITLYKEAIRINPGKVDWRERLQVISGEQPVMNLLVATPVDPILKEAQNMKALPATSAIILLNEARMVVYPDYASDIRHRMIVKVFDDAGVKRFSDIDIEQLTSASDVTIEKARLLKADGKTQDTTDQASSNKASFPSLAPGDTIDLTYRVEDYHPGALAQQFWAEWAFASVETPVKLSRFILMLPVKMTFNTREHGTIPKPTVKESNGWRISEWRMSDVPADSFEPAGTDFRDHGSWLDISTIPDWHTIVNWYRDLADPRCTPDETIRAKALELTKEAKTTEEKIGAIVNFVARKIQYQSMPFRFSQYLPTEGKQVLREHYGDCKDKAALVTALLAAVDIPANMVLLNGRDDGLTPYLPSPRFTHAINRIQTEKGPLWVDATANKAAFGILPTPDQAVSALIISPATTELTRTPIIPTDSNSMNLDAKLSLEDSGKVSGEIEVNFVGNWGWMMRNILAKVPESKHDMVLRVFITKLIANSTYESGAFRNLDDPDKPLVMSGKFHIDHATTSAGDFLILPLPWGNENTAEAFSLLTRKQDLDVAMNYGLQQLKMQLTLPDGYTPDGLKPKSESTSPWGSLTVTYRQDGRILYGEWHNSNTVLSVAADDYPKYRTYVLAMQQEEKKALVLKTK